EVDMVLGRERERLGSADPADLGGELLGVTIGCLVAGKVRDAQEELVQLLLDLHLFGLHLVDLLLEVPGTLLQAGDVTALLGCALHVLGDTLGFGSPFLGGPNALHTPRPETLQRRQIQGVTATGKLADGLRTHVDQYAGVMHRIRSPPRVCAPGRPSSRAARSFHDDIPGLSSILLESFSSRSSSLR